MNNRADEPLTLIIRSNLGSGEVTADINHPMLAALRRGLESGQLTGTWRMLAASGGGLAEPRIVGTFVGTPVGQILYFPGAQVSLDGLDGASRFADRPLDHLTLDPPTGTDAASHLAVRGLRHRKSRGIGYKAAVPPGWLVPWFSLLVPDLVPFSKLPAKLSYTFPNPGGDLKAFANRLFADGNTLLASIPESKGEPSFIQFDVWAGYGEDWQNRKSRVLPWAYKDVIANAPDPQSISITKVSIPISDRLGLIVYASHPQGTLNEAHILRPTYEP